MASRTTLFAAEAEAHVADAAGDLCTRQTLLELTAGFDEGHAVAIVLSVCPC